MQAGGSPGTQCLACFGNQAHEFMTSNTIICAVVCAVAVLLQWLFIFHLGQGALGNAWAASAFNCLYVALQVPYLWCARRMKYLFIPNSGVLSRAAMQVTTPHAAQNICDCGAYSFVLHLSLSLPLLPPPSPPPLPRPSR